jgi:L-threonylcarbamoyladenylate synthase
METKFILATENPNAAARAGDMINQGGIVAFPTETVYGIGAGVTHMKAIKKIYQIKNRPINKALSLHVSCILEARPFIQEVPDLFWALAERFLPGPLTLVVAKRPGILPEQDKFSTIGIRVPDHSLCREMIRHSGPILATSANISSQQDQVDPKDVYHTFNGLIEAVISNGCEPIFERPSTVVSINSAGKLNLLREGVIPYKEIMAFSSQCLQMHE